MNLQTRKIAIVESLLDIEDENLIIQFENLLQKMNFHKQKLQPMTKKELIARAKKSEEDIENGNIYSIEEIEEISKKW